MDWKEQLQKAELGEEICEVIDLVIDTAKGYPLPERLDLLLKASQLLRIDDRSWEN